jgi:hypothetical protein
VETGLSHRLRSRGRGAPLDAKSIAAPCYDMLSEWKNRVTVVT